MSMQQVNLYQDELKPKKLKYSAMLVVQLTLVLVVLCSAATAFRFYQLQQHEAKLALSKKQQQQAIADLQKVQAELSTRKVDRTLSTKITKITAELVKKQKVLGILSQDEFGNTDGFIEHITGLARQKIDGLWLTQIRIASGGTNVSLRGTTSSPSLLPKYLQRLSSEKAFAGTEFESLSMTRQEKRKQWLNFILQNRNEVSQ